MALGTIGFLVYETFRLAEVAGRFEVEAREARAAAARAMSGGEKPAAQPAAQPADRTGPPPAGPDADPVAYARLALELATTKEQLAAVTALLEQRNQEAAARAEAAAAAAAQANQPMPPGVRDCLTALHDCLRAEGYFGPRFLRALRVGEGCLEQVEMLDADPAGIDIAVVTAARVTATLDRGRGRLELRFFEGERARGGDRQPLPKDGWALVFDDVDGRLFEARLPYLLRVEGVYPEPSPAADRHRGDLDPLLRRQWLERLDRVLDQSGCQPAWRVTRLRGLEDGWFLVAELVGTDDKHRVVAGAHCARFAVEVDTTTGVVSLLLRDGSLRRGSVESSITGEGYRVLLPKLTCKQATDAMFGMVVKK